MPLNSVVPITSLDVWLGRVVNVTAAKHRPSVCNRDTFMRQFVSKVLARYNLPIFQTVMKQILCFPTGKALN